ncbi:Ankyrin repeat-containing protein [Theobroma cacao]|uniref:Ankyrin repeat-containing protein n=1 Tax=Theobroma cacao TaxID=3641 RepID=A0A061FNS7_THECC|nr:Ankyrin repeat-containing protein [Theobroma cacao]
MYESLSRAAHEGNIVELYASIRRDGDVLRKIDEMQFIDTPLHIAAAEGCIDFAMEIMILMPSFARKLNQEGFSPIHVAVEKGHKELALHLIENDKNLVRVKGKQGETPLHYAIPREQNFDLLARFLEACPESIRDMTTTNQTALHIATRHDRLEALDLLCQMLRRSDYCEDVVNQKDRNGDTVLHIAVRNNQPKMLRVLLKCKADTLATNPAGLTALDVAHELNNRESINILRGWSNAGGLNFQYKMRKQIFKLVTKASEVIFQGMDNVSSEDRNALLVVLGLLLTATYQASISPPAYTVFIVAFFLTLGLLKPFPHGFRTALQVLLAFLAISFDEAGSGQYVDLEKRRILNLQDKGGNTVLHIAASKRQHQMIKLLIESKKVDRNTVNQTGFTALHVLQVQAPVDSESVNTLNRAEEEVQAPSKFRRVRYFAKFEREIEEMKPDTINALLVVFALILGMSYQAVFSPPGGVLKADAGSSTKDAGKAVISPSVFVLFYT